MKTISYGIIRKLRLTFWICCGSFIGGERRRESAGRRRMREKEEEIGRKRKREK